MSINAETLLTINNWAGQSAWLDAVMVFCAVWLIFLLFAVAGVLVLRAAWRQQWWHVGFFLATLAVAFILLQFVSMLYDNNRPFVDYDLTQLVAHEAGRSFASNHTAAAFATAIGTMLFLSWRIGVPLVFVATLIGFARVFAGIHYPVDIAGGILVAIIAGVAVWGVKQLLERRQATKE